MASSIQIANATFKGIANLVITRNSDNVPFAFPKPSTFVIDEGRNERQINQRNDLGELSFAFSYPTEVFPTLQISYDVIQPEMYAMQSGYMLTTGSLTGKVPLNIYVPTSGEVVAAPTGGFRNTISLDAPAYASTIRDRKSFELTQVNTASFNAATDDTFAVGANGALKFSDNLKGAYVVLEIVSDIEGRYISTELVGDCRIHATIVDSLNQINFIEIPSAVINTSGISMDASAQNFALNFRLGAVGCRAFNLISTNQTVSC